MLLGIQRHQGLRTILWLLISLFTPHLYAAQAPLAHYYQDHWSTRDGLPHNTINAIAQTEEGYLWFATWEGAARFNGREFRVFARGEETGLPDSGLRSLTRDGAGLFAVGARGGISRYQHQQWTAHSDASAMVNHVLRDSNGMLWLATEGEGIYVRDGDMTIAHFNESDGLPSNDVYRLLQDNAGHIWVGTSQGVARIEQEKVYAVSAVPPIPVLALLLDDQHRVLIGSDRGLYVAEQQRVRLLHPKLANKSIISLLQDNQGDLWLGTTDRGLMRISQFGIERLEVTDGLPEQRVISLFQDDEASIWVGTNGGLMRLRDAPFTSYTEQHGLAGNYVRSVLAHSDGSMWVGSSTGLSHIKNGQVTRLPLTMADGTPPSVLSLAEGLTDELWVGTYTHGLLRLIQGELVDVYGRADGIAANEIRAILPAEDGSVWIGTAIGLSQLHDGVVKNYGVDNGLPGDFIMNLHQAVNGDIWVGTGAGAAIMREGTITPVYLNSQENAEYAFGFYAEPSGDYMWLATDRGLLRYRYADASLAVVGKKHGLPVEKMFQPVADKLGGLWLTTNRGILRINLAEAHRVADGLQAHIAFEHFGEGDGMVSSQANGGSGPAAALAADGSVWIATAQGVVWVQPARLAEFSHSNLPVVLESVAVSDQPVAVNSEIVLAPGSERIQLHFAGLGFVMPERIRYRTLLEGFDQQWVIRGQQHLAEYTSLPPGHYVFRVAAAYPYSDWGKQEARLAFTVLPFIWQRPLFRVMMGTVVLLVLWLAMRLRLRVLKRQAVELQRQVAEKTQALTLQAQAFELQAREDPLTGLPNRRAFDESLAEVLARSWRDQLPVSLVVIDIDHFKQVNDTFSHAVGDQVIKVVADIIRQEIREIDIPARWGGEEFTVLLPNTDACSALMICERLRKAVMNYDYGFIAPQLKLTISLGLAQIDGLTNENNLLTNADQALYQAKKQGRNQVILFTDTSLHQ